MWELIQAVPFIPHPRDTLGKHLSDSTQIQNVILYPQTHMAHKAQGHVIHRGF